MRREWAGVLLAAAALVAGFFLWRAQSARKPPAAPAVPSGSALLQEMERAGSSKETDLSGPVATDPQLEKQFALISENQQQVNDLKAQAASAAAGRNLETVQKILAQAQPLVSLLNLRLAPLQKDLDAARQARPQDPIVQWLTGELLLLVGGEPEQIVPYLNRAAAAGLKRPRLSVSLAKAEFDFNHFQAAYDRALQAIQQDPQNRDGWEITAVRALRWSASAK